MLYYLIAAFPFLTLTN